MILTFKIFIFVILIKGKMTFMWEKKPMELPLSLSVNFVAIAG
jgi:hypothetical protein